MAEFIHVPLPFIKKGILVIIYETFHSYQIYVIPMKHFSENLIADSVTHLLLLSSLLGSSN